MLIELARTVFLVASAILVVPAVVLLVQVLAAWKKDTPAQSSCPASGESPRRPSLAVLVPAHNEAAGIAATLDSIKAQLVQGDRLLVVADNCSDDTAAVAEAAGAEVVVRQHATLRGKGFALDHGLHELAALPPDVVVMVDADCIVGIGCIDRVSRLSVSSRRPVQAKYLMHTMPGSSVTQRIAAFAWVVKNIARPLGAQRLGMPCQLMGTGMAFEWKLLSGAPLATGNIVEDMQLGLDLALQGYPPLFSPEAVVTSQFPTSDAAAAIQKTRWEHGHVATLLKGVPVLALGALRRRDPRLLGLALDLSVPPLALMLLLVSTALLVGATWWWGTGDAAPALVALAVLVFFGTATGVAWWRYGRALLGARELALAPIYALSKFPMYLGYVVGRQVEWVRTKRDGER